jgi:hypothetical protein
VPSRRCHEHAGAVERDGRLTADELAAKHDLNLGQLLAHLRDGRIPAERVDRGGRPPAWLIDEDAALQVLAGRYQCRGGCGQYALEPRANLCGACTRQAAQLAAAGGARRMFARARARSPIGKPVWWTRRRHGRHAPTALEEAATYGERARGWRRDPRDRDATGEHEEAVARRLEAGQPVAKVADAVGVSRSYVERVKRERSIAPARAFGQRARPAPSVPSARS